MGFEFIIELMIVVFVHKDHNETCKAGRKREKKVGCYLPKLAQVLLSREK